MQFGLDNRVGPVNHVLDGVQIPALEWTIFEKWAPMATYMGTLVTCAKTVEPIEMPFGLGNLWTRMGPRNQVLDGGPDPHEYGQLWGKGSPIVKYRDFL